MQLIFRALKRSFNLILFLFFFLNCTSKEVQLQKIQGYALGTSYSISYASNTLQPKQLTQKLDSIFQVLNHSLSTYLPDSDISKINKGDSLLEVDTHFIKVYQKATEVWTQTKGYFDPTVGALVNAYGFGPGVPLKQVTSRERDSILEFTGWSKSKLTARNTIQKSNSKLFFDFNALAKGYAVDVITAYLQSQRVSHFLVEIGGELVARGKSPRSGEFWKIAIDDPQQKEERRFIRTLILKNQALATSGNYRKKAVDPETGLAIAHSINPKTGEAFPTSVLSASVIAPDCMTADAYATALMVMPLAQSQALINSSPELEAYWIVADSLEGIKELYSDSFFK